MKLELKQRLAFGLDVPAEKVEEMISIFALIVGWIKVNM